MTKQKIEIYQGASGQAELRAQFEGDTVWLNRQQLSELFGRAVNPHDLKTLANHSNNVFRVAELNKNATLAIFATVQTSNAGGWNCAAF